MACRETNQRGEPCGAPELPGRGWCYHHDPERAEERQRARRKGGLAVHHGGAVREVEEVSIRSVSDVLTLLERAARDVLSRKPSISRARALAYVASASLKTLEVGEIEERVAALESRLKLERIS